jgi:7,8-dihydropterin-6-yl-methyl-4-(beta-D-ribofuranosyl)aminobenzene 5'-phosphate synthase
VLFLGKITIIVDDNARAGLRPVHGISLLVECEDNAYLFDAGPDPKILEHNSNQLGISLDLIDSVIVSHIHSAHVGGLPYIGWLSPYIETHIPFGSMETLGRKLRSEGLRPIEVTGWVKLSEKAYITPPLPGPPWEHFLVLDCNGGLVIISGCMHPGIRMLLETVMKKFPGRSIRGVIGGFHLQNAPDNIIMDTINVLSQAQLSLIVPIHCSGDRFKEKLAARLPGRVRFLKAGDTIDIED